MCPTGASTASLLGLLPCVSLLCCPSELLMVFPAGKASSPLNTTVRTFFGGQAGSGQGQGWLCGGAVGIGLCCISGS